MTLQRYAVFLYLQNLDLSTSKRCIKMGISSLKSAILYCVSLYFHSNHANITNIPDHRLRKQVYFWLSSLFLTPWPRERPFFWPGNDNPILLIRHLLFTACATLGLNSPKQYHKSYKLMCAPFVGRFNFRC